MLFHFGVTPYLVFDGDRLPSKSMTEEGRRQRREESRRAGLELLRRNRSTEAQQELQKAVDITPEMARELIEQLKRYQVKYVVAPYEADSQLAYLEKQGLIDAVLSEDSDLLIFGVRNLLTKLDKFGECVVIRAQDYTSCREVNLIGWTTADLRRMAIMSGCDYLEGIHKMGLKTAHRFVRKCKTIERTIQCMQLEGKFRVPLGYLAQFDQAEKTFLYQWVFCPLAHKLVNLNPLDRMTKLEDMPFIGEQVAAEVAQGVASGHLNPMTKLPIQSVPSAASRIRTSPLRPKIGKENVQLLGKDRKINNFFRPSRIPLAELDPNTLTPSPNQWNLILENQGRTWAPEVVAQRGISSAPRAVANSSNGIPDRGVFSAPHPYPNKKQRLCAEGDPEPADAGVEAKSRFFSFVEPSPTTAVAKKKTKKNPKKTDIQLWSDDSIEEAMANLPDFDGLLCPEPSSLKLPVPKLTIFNEGRLKSPPTDSALPAASSTVDKQTKSVFTDNSLADVRYFREEYGFQKEQSARSTPRPAHSQHHHESEPMTPPPTSTAQDEAGHSGEDPSSVVKETPRHRVTAPNNLAIASSTDHAMKPSTPRRVRAFDTPNPTHTYIPGASLWKGLKSKGSEDLIVPDSDQGSECGTLSPSASSKKATKEGHNPIVTGSVHDGGSGSSSSGDDADDGGTEIETERKTLDLRKFMFGAATPGA